MSVLVSVVVPTCRRNELLRRCLAALAAQRMSPEQYEIVVADDAANRDTRQQVDDFAERCGAAVRYVAVGPRHGPAAARNCGWRTARGEIIAFTDDDCIPQPDWLQRGVEALVEADAAAGRVFVPLPPTPTDYERDCAGLARGEFVTASCFCRRGALEAVGGFDERFTAAWREDSDLQFSLLEQGFRIAAAPQAVVVHPVRPAPWGISLAQQRKACFNTLLYKKHRLLYRQRIARKPPSYYAIGASLLGCVVAASAGAHLAAAACAGLWGLLTGRFCAVRLRDTSRAPRHIAEMIVTSALIPPLSLYWHLRGLVRHRVLFR